VPPPFSIAERGCFCYRQGRPRSATRLLPDRSYSPYASTRIKYYPWQIPQCRDRCQRLPSLGSDLHRRLHKELPCPVPCLESHGARSSPVLLVAATLGRPC